MGRSALFRSSSPWLCLSLLVCGCFDLDGLRDRARTADGGDTGDASRDGAPDPSRDGAVDPSGDGGARGDGGTGKDGGPALDSGPDADGGSSGDGGQSVDCTKAGVSDGTPCGDNRICVASVCAVSRCGDGFVDSGRSEQCEDGVGATGARCTDCRLECVRNADCAPADTCAGSLRCDLDAGACVIETPAAEGDACTGAAGAGRCLDARCVPACDAAGDDPRFCTCRAGTQDCAVLAVPATTPASCAEYRCDGLQCGLHGRDADGDAHDAKRCAPLDPGTAIALGGDCDDGDDEVHPGHAELCAPPNTDDDCDDAIDEGVDRDSDGVSDLCDNCPDDANPTQVDIDGDGRGWACDPLTQLPRAFTDTAMPPGLAAAHAMVAGSADVAIIGYHDADDTSAACSGITGCGTARGLLLDGLRGAQELRQAENSRVARDTTSVAVAADRSAFIRFGNDTYAVRNGAVSMPFGAGVTAQFQRAPDGFDVVRLSDTAGGTQALHRWRAGASEQLLAPRQSIALTPLQGAIHVLTDQGVSTALYVYNGTIGPQGVGSFGVEALGTTIVPVTLADNSRVAADRIVYCSRDNVALSYTSVSGVEQWSFSNNNESQCAGSPTRVLHDEQGVTWTSHPNGAINDAFGLRRDNTFRNVQVGNVGVIRSIVRAGSGPTHTFMVAEDAGQSATRAVLLEQGTDMKRMLTGWDDQTYTAPSTDGRLFAGDATAGTPATARIAIVDGPSGQLYAPPPITLPRPMFPATTGAIVAGGAAWAVLRSADSPSSFDYRLVSFMAGDANVTTVLPGGGYIRLSVNGSDLLASQGAKVYTADPNDPRDLVEVTQYLERGAGGATVMKSMSVGADGHDALPPDNQGYMVAWVWQPNSTFLLGTFKSGVLRVDSALKEVDELSAELDRTGQMWVQFSIGLTAYIVSFSNGWPTIHWSGTLNDLNWDSDPDGRLFWELADATGYMLALSEGGVFDIRQQGFADIRRISGFGYLLIDGQGRHTYCPYVGAETGNACHLLDIASPTILDGPRQGRDGTWYVLARDAAGTQYLLRFPGQLR